MAETENRFEMKGPWQKGSLHLHTDRSDGMLGVDAVAGIYADAGYDFIAVTDHWKTFTGSGGRPPLSIVGGVELDGWDAEGGNFHVVAVGLARAVPEGVPFPEALADAREQGAVLLLAHPHWTGNSVEEALRHDLHGLEIYNHGCHCEIGKGYAHTHWDAVLEEKPGFLRVAVDDAHFRPESHFWGGGWVMVDAEDAAPEALLPTIRGGRFYASQGPSFLSVTAGADGRIRARTSPVRFARLIGPRHRGLWKHEPTDFEEASFRLPKDWGFARLEIEDARGRRAWTNPIPLP